VARVSESTNLTTDHLPLITAFLPSRALPPIGNWESLSIAQSLALTLPRRSQQQSQYNMINKQASAYTRPRSVSTWSCQRTAEDEPEKGSRI